ncbi:hypothetical protein ACFLUZ_00770 [Chloroflexota bacterium]
MTNYPPLVSARLDVPDSLEEINELFYQKEWTDGLPIIPPTEARVARMLSGTTRKPQEVLGEIPPRWGEAIVEKVAINAVMAGCLPEYMPVVLTALESMLEPQFNLYAIQVTTHPCAPLIIVNGPIRKKLGINSGCNVFGQGTRANATIGRAIRLALINIGGAIPGKLDRATHGQPSKYSFCIAENEEESPWSPLHVDRNFDPLTSTVTVLAAASPLDINDNCSIDAEGVLTTIAGSIAIQGSNNTLHQNGEPLIIISPQQAVTIAGSGFSKQDVKHFLFQKAVIPYDDFAQCYQATRLRNFKAGDLIHLTSTEDKLIVVVTGGTGPRAMFCTNFGQTVSVTKPIHQAPG